MTVAIDKKPYREQRDRTWQDMAAIVSKADAEKRNLTSAEAEEYDRLDRHRTELDKVISGTGKDAADTRGNSFMSADEIEQREAAFTRYMRSGNAAELRTTYGSGLGEAGFQSSGTSGGYMVPQGFWDQLTIAMKKYGGFAEYYRQVLTDTGNPMDWPTVDPTGVVGAIIGEGVIDGFTTYTFGQGVLNAWTYTNQVILASMELVRDSAFDVQSFVFDRIAEAIGRAEGAHSVSGSGSGQPLGLITALAAGTRYVTLSAATSTNIVGGGTVTELIGNVLSGVTIGKMVQAVDSAYWPNAAFYFSPAQFVAQLNLADSYGRPLYESLQQAEPTLMGFPVHIVAETPALTASTAGGPVFGDLSIAMVRRRVDSADLMVLDQRYADARQIGYYGYVRQDHRSNDLRSAVTVKPAAT
jgi:HK97 family phage major capsid protein